MCLWIFWYIFPSLRKQTRIEVGFAWATKEPFMEELCWQPKDLCELEFISVLQIKQKEENVYLSFCLFTNFTGAQIHFSLVCSMVETSCTGLWKDRHLKLSILKQGNILWIKASMLSGCFCSTLSQINFLFLLFSVMKITHHIFSYRDYLLFPFFLIYRLMNWRLE